MNLRSIWARLWSKRLPWKALACRLRIQRNVLVVENAKQKRLLVWILNQIALERSAGDELATSREWDRLLSRKSNHRGQS